MQGLSEWIYGDKWYSMHALAIGDVQCADKIVGK